MKPTPCFPGSGEGEMTSGLTNDQILEMADHSGLDLGYESTIITFARLIEAALVDQLIAQGWISEQYADDVRASIRNSGEWK